MSDDDIWLHRIALALGKTIAELESSITKDEFNRWIVYWYREPFGAWRDNWHMAQLATLYAKVHSPKGAKASPGDFMYKTPEQRRKESTQRILKSFSESAKSNNGKSNTGKTDRSDERQLHEAGSGAGENKTPG